MSAGKLSVPNLDFQSELSIAQFVIPAGAGATFAAANNIGTITFNAAHGLTLSPAAGVPPNYFITFGGSTSGLTGTGILVGNIFRILSIPSTTAITIYTTITAATVTSLTGIPVFFSPFTAGGGGPYGPSQVPATAGTYPLPNLSTNWVYARMAANCAIRINTDLTAQILDSTTGNTPGTAPAWADIAAASTNDVCLMSAPNLAVWANGTTATSKFQVLA